MKSLYWFLGRLVGIWLLVYSYPFLVGDFSIINFTCFIVMATSGCVLIERSGHK